VPGRNECRKLLYPTSGWFDDFPKKAKALMNEKGIEKELNRMRKKVDHFEEACESANLSMRDVYATAQKCHEMFIKPKGEFSWFFRDMQLAHREGSFLFIHAGLDDQISDLLENKSINHINKLYKKTIKNDLFQFYYGPLANTMRTKYRESDLPLTEHGVEKVYRNGVHAIVHGHRNRLNGQQIMLRQGMMHIESDITMDRNSRKKEGLDHYGAGVTIIDPDKHVIGISTDYPYAKVFQPEKYM
jgi:hypothetical protein